MFKEEVNIGADTTNIVFHAPSLVDDKHQIDLLNDCQHLPSFERVQSSS